MRLQLNTSFMLLLIVFIIQFSALELVTCESEEDTGTIPDAAFIPPLLRDILTEEVGKFEISSETKKKFVYYLSGFDYENRPVWVVEFGHWDIRRSLEERPGEFDRFIRHAVYRGLNSTRIMSTEDKPVDNLIVFVDMDGFELKQLSSVSTLRYVLGQYQRFLPAFSKVQTVYIVNSNFLGIAFVNLLRPILGRVSEKMEVYGTNKAKWIPIILKNIPRDQLPESYGGVKNFVPYQAKE